MSDECSDFSDGNEYKFLLPETPSELSSGSQYKYQSISQTVNETSLTSPVTLHWHKLNAFVAQERSVFSRCAGRQKCSKQILFNVSGSVEPFQLVALMGASGAGKTTLLNILTSRNCRSLSTEGEILVNSQEIGNQIANISAYIQQDDLFPPVLTVKEHLFFQASLRLSKSVSKKDKALRVQNLIFELGLQRCQNTRMGSPTSMRGVSGGEAKRVAFASEVLTDPPALFCDEPTTGLDSYTAEKVVNFLKKLASKGKMVVCTIHQPASEVYHKFDKVYFLAEGRTAFFGSPIEALGFFASLGYQCPANYNPADYFLEILAVTSGNEGQSRKTIDEICSSYASMKPSDKASVEVIDRVCSGYPKKQSNSLFLQFTILLWRSLICNYRHLALAVAKLLQKIFMGTFLGLIYTQTTLNQEGIMNINGALFFILAELSYAAVFGVITFLPSEFPLVVREHHSGLYGVGVYYWSKALSLVPVFTIDGIFFISISYYLIGLRPQAGAFLFSLFIGVLVEQTACAFGTMLAAVSPNFPVALSLAGPLMTLMMMTGGLFANVDSLPSYIKWIQYISWWRYGYEALSVNQWTGIGNITCKYAATYCVHNGEEVLRQLSFDAMFMNRNVLMLFVLITIYYIIGYAALKIRVFQAR